MTSIIRTMKPWAPAGMSEGPNCHLRLREVIMNDRAIKVCKWKGGKEEAENFVGVVTPNTVMLQQMNEC